VLWRDSWRLWEAMVSGCVAFRVDFEQCRIELPVMPQIWVHYIGIDLDKPQAVIDRIKVDPMS